MRNVAVALSPASDFGITLADSLRQIIENNIRAVVYIEIQNADKSVVDHGSGFMVPRTATCDGRAPQGRSDAIRPGGHRPAPRHELQA